MKLTNTRSKSVLALGASVGVLLFAASAHAQMATEPQTDDATAVDEVVVTGFRASLANALNIKRREAGVVDAISAEDIALGPIRL